MPTRDELLTTLKEVAEEMDKIPSTREIENKTDYTYGQYRWEFDSWSSALQAANLEVPWETDDDGKHKKLKETASGHDVSDEELLSDIRRVGRVVGRRPTYKDIQEKGEYMPQTSQKRFGSWNNALEEAGFDRRPVNGTEEQNFNWRGGTEFNYKHGYGKKRKEALKRDNHSCVVCGMTKDEHQDEFGWSLEVHHITPARKFENPSDAHDLENLMTLCRSCHQKWEKMPIEPQIDS